MSRGNGGGKERDVETSMGNGGGRRQDEKLKFSLHML